MKTAKSILLALAVAAAGTVLAQTVPAAKIKPSPGPQVSFEERMKAVKEAEGKPLPAFQMKRLDDSILTNKDLKGKVVVIKFWASW